MKVYSQIVIDIESGKVVSKKCIDHNYSGPVAKCDGGGGGGGGGGKSYDTGQGGGGYFTAAQAAGGYEAAYGANAPGVYGSPGYAGSPGKYGEPNYYTSPEGTIYMVTNDPYNPIAVGHVDDFTETPAPAPAPAPAPTPAPASDIDYTFGPPLASAIVEGATSEAYAAPGAYDYGGGAPLAAPAPAPEPAKEQKNPFQSPFLAVLQAMETMAPPPAVSISPESAAIGAASGLTGPQAAQAATISAPGGETTVSAPAPTEAEDTLMQNVFWPNVQAADESIGLGLPAGGLAQGGPGSPQMSMIGNVLSPNIQAADESLGMGMGSMSPSEEADVEGKKILGNLFKNMLTMRNPLFGLAKTVIDEISNPTQLSPEAAAIVQAQITQGPGDYGGEPYTTTPTPTTVPAVSTGAETLPGTTTPEGEQKTREEVTPGKVKPDRGFLSTLHTGPYGLLSRAPVERTTLTPMYQKTPKFGGGLLGRIFGTRAF